MSEELKPCPFCGGSVTAWTWKTREGDRFDCTCDDCTVGQMNCETREEAVEAWNTHVAEPVLPIPCTNVKEKTVKDWFAKIDEELEEFKAEVYKLEFDPYLHCQGSGTWNNIAEEAADVITAITSYLESIGIPQWQRQEAQRRVNAKNKERGRF